MTAIIIAAALFTTTEGSPRVESKIEPAETHEGIVLFDKTEEGQEFLAWGTTFNELDLDAISLLKKGEREKILFDLFDPEGDLRFTRGRLTMNANDYSRTWYSCSEKEGDFELKEFNIEHDKANQLKLVKMAMKYNPGLKFFVSPWSPPAWMKINKDYPVLSSKFNNQPKEKDALLFDGESDAVDPDEMKFEGGRTGRPFPRRLATRDYFIQEPRYLQAYADMFVKFIRLYREEGVEIDRVMYQNEAYSYTPYPGCPWTASGTVRFNRDYLGPTLKRELPGVKLYIGTFNTNRGSYIDQILSAEGMEFDGIGFQWEGRETIPYFRKKFPKAHLVCSESECGNGSMDWKAGEHTSWLIFENLGNGCDEWYNWNFILCDRGESPWGWRQNALIRVDSKAKTYSYRPEYWAVWHFSRFIQPGAIQLAYSSWKRETEAIAYRNPDGSKAVVITNWAKEARKVSFALDGQIWNLELKPRSFNTLAL